MNNTSPRYKAVIYDCDGVMFNSLDANFAFYNSVFGHMGIKLDRNDIEMMRIIHTFANRDVLNHFFPERERWDEAVRFAGSIDYRKLFPLLKMEAGYMETLDRLKDHVKLAVCTNRSSSMDALLEEFDLAGYFSMVMTASKASFPKPHPDPLHRILAYYGIEPGEALFVGDSAVDQQAAAAANVPFVAYRSDLPSLAVIQHHEEILTHIY
ncbi:MAG TPA: HAD family hydrolase [Geobacteraceae bacterium]|nr:HAD family hydrolase [Geobacteraceae bacterium]